MKRLLDTRIKLVNLLLSFRSLSLFPFPFSLSILSFFLLNRTKDISKSITAIKTSITYEAEAGVVGTEERLGQVLKRVSRRSRGGG